MRCKLCVAIGCVLHLSFTLQIQEEGKWKQVLADFLCVLWKELQCNNLMLLS